MTYVFLSHGGVDTVNATRVRDHLLAAGVEALFLDFDSVSGIPAGRAWEQELYSQVRRADAMIFLATPASISSPWCFAELCLARSLRLPILPLEIDEGQHHPLLTDVQALNFDKADPEALRKWLLSVGLEANESILVQEDRPPYPGLRPFAAHDAAYFFGRTGEIAKLLELLEPTMTRSAGRFVGIVGPSGSGKSSLLHAGLRPRLARSTQPWVVLAPFSPGRKPDRRLALRLTSAFSDHGSERPTAEILAKLRKYGARALIDLASELADLTDDDARVLVVIDQAEELITRSTDAEQRDFLSMITGALSDGSPVWAIATIRSEYLSSRPDRLGLASSLDDVVEIKPLGADRLHEIILRPARRADLHFEDGLVGRIVADAAGGDALPLLAYTLRRLEQQLGPTRGNGSREITAAAYEKIGGVLGALSDHADRLVTELGRRGYGDLVIPTLLRFTTVERDDEPTRRRVSQSELSGREVAVVSAFVDASLLVTDADLTTSREATIEVAHEALLRRWPQLREAIEEGRDRLRLRAELERLTDDWTHNSRDQSYLLRGLRLGIFDQWAKQNARDVGANEARFLDASRAQHTAELDRAHRANRRLRFLTVWLCIFLIGALGAGGLAIVSQQRATAAQRAAVLRGVSVAADSARGQDPHAALQLALAAYAIEPNQSTEARILETLTASPYLASLIHHTAAVGALAYAPEGNLLASADDDGRLVLWDLRIPHQFPVTEPLPRHVGPIRAVAVSPRGHLIATGGADHTIVLWDFSNINDVHSIGAPLKAHNGEVLTLAFAPDGTTLATGSDDQTAILWDVTDPEHSRIIGEPLRGHSSSIFSMEFSPDGTTLATGSLDTTVRLWNVTDRAHPALWGPPVVRNTKEVLAISFSPDGHLLATAGLDEVALLWDVRDIREPRQIGPPLTANTDYIKTLAFSPDNRFLATGGDDRRAVVWDVSDTTRPVVVHSLTGHAGGVTAVRFAPDGRTLVTASRDRTLVLWDVADHDAPHLLGEPVTGGDLNWAAALTPDGRTAVTGSGRDVILWDVHNLREPVELARLQGHLANVHGLAVSPSGRILATASADWTILLWDITDRRKPSRIGPPLQGHGNWVNAVAFLPDGGTLVSAGADLSVRLWDVSDPLRPSAIAEPLEGHTATVQSLAVFPGGQYIATAGWDRRTIIWDVSEHARPRIVGIPFSSQVEPISSLAISSDGRLLAAASRDKSIALWDVSDPVHVRLLSLRGDDADRPLTTVAFAPDNRTLVTGSADGAIRFYDVTNTGEIRPLGRQLTQHHQEVRTLTFSVDGRTLISGGSDNQILRWDVSAFSDLRRDAVLQACLRAAGSLEPAAWANQTSGYPYQNPCDR